MASPIYSKRFIFSTGQTVDVVVPAGKKWSIKTVMALNTGATVQPASLEIQGLYVWYRQVAGASTQLDNLTLVCNGGEHVRAAAGSAGVNITVSGFEFDA